MAIGFCCGWHLTVAAASCGTVIGPRGASGGSAGGDGGTAQRAVRQWLWQQQQTQQGRLEPLVPGGWILQAVANGLA